MSSYPPAAKPLADLQPRQPFFVGIDSDGCAFDSMEIKHKECFCPNIIKWWDLQAVSKYAREAAEFVNLYSKWRGINRWPALVMVLDLLRERPEVVARRAPITEAKELKAFMASGQPLSDAGLKAYMAEHPHPELDKALDWSKAVNASIADMVHGCGPFPGVREAMIAMQPDVDCMTVSATPLHALEYEWNAHGIAQYMKVIAGQEMGSKAEHVQYAAQGKYADGHIMLIGDAPGDRDAAAKVGCLYYPILPGSEKESWARFTAEALPRFLAGEFSGDYQRQLIEEFDSRLPDQVPWPTISGNSTVTMPKVK